MKLKKYLLIGAVAVMVAALALVGCSAEQKKEDQPQQQQSTEPEITLVTPGTLTIVSDVPYAPYEFYDAEGNVIGLDIDIMQAVADKLGYTLDVKVMDFDGIIPAIVSGGQGDVGAAAFSVSPERAEEIDFTSTYFIDNQSIAVMDNSPITEANAQEQLNQAGITIAVQMGTTSEEYIKENYPNATVQAYKNCADAFAAMQSGQADAVCANQGVINQMLNGVYSDARVVLEVATGEEYAFVVSQDNPELTKAINGALAELVSDGTIDQIINKYMSSTELYSDEVEAPAAEAPAGEAPAGEGNAQ